MQAFFKDIISDFHLCDSDVEDPVILTREQQLAEQKAQAEELGIPFAPYETFPDISIQFRVGGSEGADVYIDLLDTGHEDNGVIQYDADIHVGNDDSVGPKFMLGALAVCMKKFYDMGLNTKFGKITGDF